MKKGKRIGKQLLSAVLSFSLVFGSVPVHAEEVPEVETEMVTEAVTEAAAEPVTEAVTEAAAEPVTEAVTEAAAEPVTEAVTEVVTEAAVKPETEAVMESEAEQETETVTTEAETEAVTEAATEPMTEAVTEAATESDTEVATEPVTETVTEKETEQVTEAATEPMTETETESVIQDETERDKIEEQTELDLHTQNIPLGELSVEQKSTTLLASEYSIPTVDYLVKKNAKYSEIAEGAKLLNVSCEGAKIYIYHANKFTYGMEPSFSITVGIDYQSVVSENGDNVVPVEYRRILGNKGWEFSGNNIYASKDFYFDFDTTGNFLVNLPEVKFVTPKRWEEGKVVIPYNGTNQKLVTVSSGSEIKSLDIQNSEAKDIGEYDVKAAIELKRGYKAYDSSVNGNYYDIAKWVETTNNAGNSVYTKSIIVKIIPVDMNIDVTDGVFTIPEGESRTVSPEELINMSNASLIARGVNEEQQIACDISYTWDDGTQDARTLVANDYTIKATITPDNESDKKNYNTATADIEVKVLQEVYVSYNTKSNIIYNGEKQELVEIVGFSSGNNLIDISSDLYTVSYKNRTIENTTGGADEPVDAGVYEIRITLKEDCNYVFFENKKKEISLGEIGKIEPLPITIESVENTYEYDGEAHYNIDGYMVTYGNHAPEYIGKESISVQVIYEMIRYTGDTLQLKQLSGPNITTVADSIAAAKNDTNKFDFSCNIVRGDKKVNHNYDIKLEKTGILSITPAKKSIDIQVVDEAKVYDGSPLENVTVNINGEDITYGTIENGSMIVEGSLERMNGDYVKVFMEGSITEVGEAEKKITRVQIIHEDNDTKKEQVVYDSADPDVISSYDADMITTKNGKLKITMAEGKVEIGETGKVYDGLPAATPEFTALRTADSVDSKDVTVEWFEGTEASEEKRLEQAPHEAGIYTVKITVAADHNYKEASAMKEFVIEPKTVTVVPKANQSKVYGETEPEFDYDADLIGKDVLTGELGRTEGETAGFYDFTLGTLENENYELQLGTDIPQFEISRRELTVDVAVAGKQYDGTDKAEISGTVTLLNVVEEDAGKVILNNGTPTFDEVHAAEDSTVSFTDFTLSGDEEVLKNYNLTQPTGITASIYNDYTAAKAAEHYVLTDTNENGWLNQDFIVEAKEGYEISLSNTAKAENWTDVLKRTEETDSGELKFYVREKMTGAISLEVTENYQIDKTNPTGTIELVDTAVWKEFSEDITFDDYYNEMKVIRITAEDTLSGIASVEYCESASAMTLEEVKAIEAWKAYGDGVAVTLEDAKRFVYFARITDVAGNVIYLSTDGSVYDTTLPYVSGVTDGETYYTTRKVVVSDYHLEKVTLNGVEQTIEQQTVDSTPIGVTDLVLEGNKDAVYEITATDKAGNITKVKVTMKPISTLSEDIESITNETVTGEDRKKIEQAKDEISKVDTSDATEAEKEALEKAGENCDGLIGVLDTAKEEAENAVKPVDDTKKDGISVTEKETLETQKNHLASVLDKNQQYLSKEEKEKLQGEIADLNAVIDVISKIQQAQSVIEQVKTEFGEAAVPGNEESVKAFEAAQKAFDKLTDEQKAMIGEDVKTMLTAAESAVAAYKIVEGDGQSWTNGSDKGLTFTANGLVEKFVSVTVDGSVLNQKDYSVKAGSTVVTLKKGYLNGLEDGTHTIVVNYVDGNTDKAEFEIIVPETEIETEAKAENETEKAVEKDSETEENAEAAKTGDSTNIWLWVSMMMVSAIAMAGIWAKVLMRRRQRHS